MKEPTTLDDTREMMARRGVPPGQRGSGGRWGRGTVAAVVAAVLLAVVIVSSYLRGHGAAERERDAEAPVAAPSRTRTANGEIVVEMNAASRARGGIIVSPVKASEGGGTTGYGRVIPLDTIAALHNEYVAAQSAEAEARARADASRREYGRLAALHADEQNVAAKAVEQARAAMLADEAALAAAIAPARTIVATARQSWGAVVGDWITRGSAEFDRLMSGRNVLVQVTVPFGESGASLPAPRSARLETGPGTATTARYVSTAARTDPAIQGPSFYYVAPASPTLLPGMNVTAIMTNGGRTERGVAIPDSAIVWADGAPWVYVELDSLTFARRRISVGVPAAAGGAFVTTIPPDTPIVVRGAQVLLAEELRSRLQGSGEDES